MSAIYRCLTKNNELNNFLLEQWSFFEYPKSTLQNLNNLQIFKYIFEGSNIFLWALQISLLSVFLMTMQLFHHRNLFLHATHS